MLGAWGVGQGPGLGKTEEGGGSRPGDTLGRPEVGSKARAQEGEWGARSRGSCAGRAGVAAVSQVIKPHEQGTGPHRPSQRRSTLGPAAPAGSRRLPTARSPGDSSTNDVCSKASAGRPAVRPRGREEQATAPAQALPCTIYGNL